MNISEREWDLLVIEAERDFDELMAEIEAAWIGNRDYMTEEEYGIPEMETLPYSQEG